MAEAPPELFYLTDKGLVSAVTSIQNDPGNLFAPDDPNVQVHQVEEVMGSEEGEIVVMTSEDLVSITKATPASPAKASTMTSEDLVSITKATPASPAKASTSEAHEIAVDNETPSTSQEPVAVTQAVYFKQERRESLTPTLPKKPMVFSDDPYNDPPDPDCPFTFRVFNCLRDVQTIIDRVQEEVGVKFFCCTKGKNFGVEENWDPTKADRDYYKGDQGPQKTKYRILFKSATTMERSMGRIALPFIPATGLPFVAVSSCIMCCEHMNADKNNSSLKSLQVMEYRRKVEAGEIIHVEPPPPEPRPLKQELQQYEYFEDQEEDVTAAAFLLETIQSGEFTPNGPNSSPPKRKWKKKKYKRRSGILPPGVSRYRESKKTGCNAALTVRQIVTFPEYRLPNSFLTQQKRIQQMNKELRAKLDNNEDFEYEMRYYVRIPNSWAHSGHPINIENPKYISQKFRDHVINYLMHLKERELLSDIKFNVPDQKRPVKLHSAVLACAGSKIRDLLLSQNYGGLAEMLMPLNKESLDAFFKFVYSGRLEITPGVDLDVLESVFNAGAIKEGAQLCSNHKTNPKPPEINNWSITNQSNPVRYLRGGVVKTEPLQDLEIRPLVDALADHGSLIKQTSSAFMARTKGLAHQEAHKIYDTLCNLFVREDTKMMCERIEELYMTEKDTRSLMKKVMLERLDLHLSGKLRARPIKHLKDKATSMQFTPNPLEASPLSITNIPSGLSSLPFILVPGTPLAPAVNTPFSTPTVSTPQPSVSHVQTPKGRGRPKKVDLRKAILVHPEDVRGSKSKIIDVKKSIAKLDDIERIEQAEASARNRSQAVQVLIDQLSNAAKRKVKNVQKVELAKDLPEAKELPNLDDLGEVEKKKKNQQRIENKKRKEVWKRKKDDADVVLEMEDFYVSENKEDDVRMEVAEPAEEEDKEIPEPGTEDAEPAKDKDEETLEPGTEDAEPAKDNDEETLEPSTEDAEPAKDNDEETLEPGTEDAEPAKDKDEEIQKPVTELADIPELEQLLADKQAWRRQGQRKSYTSTVKKSKPAFVKRLGLVKTAVEQRIVPESVEKAPVAVNKSQVAGKIESPLEGKRTLRVILKRTEVGSKRKAEVPVDTSDVKKTKDSSDVKEIKEPEVETVTSGRARRTVKERKKLDL